MPQRLTVSSMPCAVPRNIGDELPGAVADPRDNNLDGDATRIDVSVAFEGAVSWLRIAADQSHPAQELVLGVSGCAGGTRNRGAVLRPRGARRGYGKRQERPTDLGIREWPRHGQRTVPAAARFYSGELL